MGKILAGEKMIEYLSRAQQTKCATPLEKIVLMYIADNCNVAGGFQGDTATISRFASTSTRVDDVLNALRLLEDQGAIMELDVQPAYFTCMVAV